MYNLRKEIMVASIAMSLMMTGSCKHDPDMTGVPEVTFSTVQGILSSNCTFSGCHDVNSGNNDEGKFSLIGYDNVMENGDVKPGKAKDSDLYKVLIGKEETMPPPPRSPLSDDDIKRIYLWIEQGAKNN
jgi:hypothetical protein